MIRIRLLVTRWQGISLAAVLATVMVLGLRYLGVLQGLELGAYDQLLRWRSSPPLPPDDRIRIVTIDEADLQAGGQSLISDRALAKALKILAAQNPRVIGIDLYRDLPVPPGNRELVNTLQEIPNIVGIQKIAHPTVAPPPILAEKGRAKANDFVLDADHRVRRAFLFVPDKQNIAIDAFSPYLALWFLEETQGIRFEKLSEDHWRLGAATFERFGAFDGGYVWAHTGAYQLLINYRGSGQQFEHIPFRDVMAGKLPPNWAENRIVLIGATAESLNDMFATPFSGIGDLQFPTRLSGVEIHAHITSQILDAATGDRPLIRVISEPLEILWILLWSALGAMVMWPERIRDHSRANQPVAPQWLILILLGQMSIMLSLLGILMGSSYGLFLQAVWLPIVPPILGFVGAGSSIILYTANKVHQVRQRNKFLSYLVDIDGLTQVANRRSFDKFLQKAWTAVQQEQQQIALILCDVDYFKRYNDTYGHQAGDDCLRQVAYALTSSVIHPGGMVARYGGEEFAVILPRLELAKVEAIAAHIQRTLQKMNLSHGASEVSTVVTISMGIAITTPTNVEQNAEQLIQWADAALYQAKEQGRNCYHSAAPTHE